MINSKSNLKLLLILFASVFVLTGIAAPPSNDGFTSAELLSGTSGAKFGVTTEATREASEPIHALNRGGKSVWYKFVSPGNGVLRLSTVESNFNTLLAVYTGTSLANLKLVANMDNFAPDATYGTMTIGTEINRTYYVAVDGYNDEGVGAVSGDLKLTYNFANVSVSDNFTSAHALLAYPRGKRVESNVGASKQL